MDEFVTYLALPLARKSYADDKADFSIEKSGNLSFYVNNYNNGGEISVKSARKLRDWLVANVKD